ncbi:hypothetical protein [Algoriphagus chordae]|uniref:Uncharacterized protein n=1 Tax=Algoriphagus chordae TaxID=237019 RepID=A0A2W7R8U0_9BACT|nr:hypothetical protein [Algoriphagus chordae]PZX54810.1 hypothetical protein LV85_01148 [Algoriphagus chordae]
MKRRGFLWIFILLIISAILFYVWPWEDVDDLGELNPVPAPPKGSNKRFCKYKIKKVTCENPQYKVGQTICIECCKDEEDKEKRWPKSHEQSSTDICPRWIEFHITEANPCTIRAERITELCDVCTAQEAVAFFPCPVK